jgi:hypothetical protein
LEFRNVDFCGGRKTVELDWRKTLEARERINNKLNSHMTPSTGIESGNEPEITVVRSKRLAATPPMRPMYMEKPTKVKSKIMKYA